MLKIILYYNIVFTIDARRFSLLTNELLFYARQVSVMAFSRIQNLHIIASYYL